MRQRVVGTVLAVLIISCGLGVQSAAAISQNIVISSIQLGTAASATHELVVLYNNEAVDTEITNWCVYYASATSITNGSKLGCFVVDSNSLHLFLPAKSQAFLVSSALRTASPTLGSDLIFSATLSGTAGHVRIIDGEGAEVDKLGWGLSALSPESSPVPTAPNGQVITRKLVATSPSTLQDTDNNMADFVLTTAPSAHMYGSVYEVQDVCTNISEIQLTVPDMFTTDGAGTCLPPPIDQCSNIDGMQAALPPGFGFDDTGGCIDVDVCHNVPDTQMTLPDYYVVDDSRYCVLMLPVLVINEVMPNPDGDDQGNEFIEMYNPNISDVLMDMYVLLIGQTLPKVYHFPAGTVIPAGAYMSFSNDDINFTLLNTATKVSLVDPDGQIISLSEYVDPPAGHSWGIIDGLWQYSNVPTENAANQISIPDPDVEEEVTAVRPCAPNQYRHPDTNRCRLLVTTGSVVAPCKDNQYRSEETNRCRTIASSVTALASCGVNQERNPETSRCRNVVTAVPSVPFAVEPIVDTGSAVIGWWALGGVGILALAYGTWEWRTEIAKASRRLAGFFVRTK